MEQARARNRGGRMLPIAVVVVAVVLQLVVLVPFTLGSGLVAPAWAMILLVLLWLGFAGALVATARRRPLWTPLIPVVNAALLWLAIAAGGALLGWTA